jgi:AmmeMemoRadiSam system protein B
VGNFTFVPICLAAPNYAFCSEIGNAIADVVKDQPIGILASSDLNHYENQEITLRKDQSAIDQVVALNPEALWRVVDEEDISMCGFIPTTTMLIAAKKLGANSATLIKHATSGDINGDYAHVVGYAAIVIS